MAEGYAKQLLHDKYTVYSAGSQPGKYVNPLAVQVMQEVGIDMSAHVPTNIDTLLNNGYKPTYVLTVCGDTCPRIPNTAISLHISITDPSEQSNDIPIEIQLIEYRRVRDEIKQMVLTLPERFAELS
jgi:arsenate reductase